MINTSRASVLMTPQAPTPARGPRLAALGNEGPNPPREAAQTNLALAERADGVGLRGHPGLNALYEPLVLHADPAVDAPVEIARRAHFPARIGMGVGDLADHRLGG